MSCERQSSGSVGRVEIVDSAESLMSRGVKFGRSEMASSPVRGREAMRWKTAAAVTSDSMCSRENRGGMR